MDLGEQFERNKLKDQSKPDKSINQIVAELLGQKRKFEADRVELQKKNAALAWRVALGFGVVAILAVVAVVALTPLKETVPYLIKVDNVTGQTEIVNPLDDAQTATYGEALDKYWTKNFIIKRNSYNWQTVQSDYDAVMLMSSRSVFEPYSAIMRSEQSPVEVFSNFNSIEVKVKSVKFLPRSDENNVIAQVSFTRDIKGSNGLTSSKYVITNWEATLTFDYLGEMNTEEERLINPLGYRVTSYREDIVN
ncbi:type IV secretion system protein [Vibrio vulnificus]|uniref:virB8 family protein n=1 Tax=Vibrio vulnificus TaxID=672 RepID=UPI00405A4B53